MHHFSGRDEGRVGGGEVHLPAAEDRLARGRVRPVRRAPQDDDEQQRPDPDPAGRVQLRAAGDQPAALRRVVHDRRRVGVERS